MLRATWADGRGHFAVEDTGPGIDPSELPGVFEAFAQSETGRRTREGAGLGLAISRNLARLLGGDVTLRSRPGEGTLASVEVALPLTSEAPAQERLRRGGRVVGLASGQKPPLVLVVDDSADDRRLLTELLRSAGCRVAPSADGETAVSIWRDEKAELVFMDLRMPGMGGLAAIGRIREDAARGEGTAPRIVAISASALEHERDEALALGADAFLAKPFREDAVFALIEKLTGARFERRQVTVTTTASIAARASAPAPGRLAALPADLLERLATAAAGGELETLLALAAEASSFDRPLGEELAACSRDYRFDEIETALAEARRGHGT